MLGLTATVSAAPVYLNMAEKDAAKLERETARVMAMNDQEVLNLLPKRSGIYFVKCPVKNCGNAQGQRYSWSPDRPDVITCKFCKTSFPSAAYPENKTVRVVPPSGKTLEYRYYESPEGLEYYFRAGIEFRKAEWFSTVAYKLGQLYQLTGDAKYARRAALIISGIARNYPDFAWKYDFPFSKVEWENGVPKKLRPSFRTARWSWWAYMDIPRELVLAYDLIKPQVGEADRTLIEGFFKETCDGVLANQDQYHNMSPVFWIDLIIVGRVTDSDKYVRTAMDRSNLFMDKFFHFDGFWQEAALSYHHQSSGLINGVSRYLDGYGDFNAATGFPALKAALDLSKTMRYPDGRPVPMADTWMRKYSSQKPVTDAQSYLYPAIGYAMLGDAENQFHLAFTPKNGHRHYDTLGISLYSHGREMLSDLGYTHTRMHQYGVMTPAHNMVTVDQQNHATGGIGRGKGNIEYMDIDDPAVRIIAVDARAAQPKLSHNRRAAFMVRCGQGDDYYIADFYELGKGAECYDYFLYGDADRDDVLTVRGADGKPLQPEPFAMMPEAERRKWRAPEHEQDWKEAFKRYFAYGYFKDTVLNKYNPGDDSVRLDFTADGSTCSVFVPVKDEKNLRILTGKGPSHRRSNENNHTVMNYFRNFLCLRYEKPDQDVAYTNVIHPHGGESLVRSVERLRPNLLKINLPERTDYVFVHLDRPFEANGVKLSGLYGLVSFGGDGQVVHRHVVRQSVASDITAAEGSVLRYRPVRLTDPSPFLKVVNPGTGIAYGYFSDRIGPDSTQVAGPLGFEVVDGALKFKSFPQYHLKGKNQTVFFERDVNNTAISRKAF